ncbi:unnamed protein product [Rotaria magnacalcarata]|uniref:Uncharacterized protein n=2 Tax=Rotaria magnacalcarata TaxID=392030 RepID=A0A815IAZ1_9BILA|nr:unnamed protein product [Rotaria magnacalcarata]CAF3860611.1 unnamed protein product [Rotaria magnacalcarata]
MKQFLVEIKERPTILLDVPKEYKQGIEDACNEDPSHRPTCFELTERMFKKMNNVKRRDRMKTVVGDINYQQEENTQISIPVAEENRLTGRLPNIIIFDTRPTTEESMTTASSTSTLSSKPAYISARHRFERLLSKSDEDFSTNDSQMISNAIISLSNSTTCASRSIIGEIVTSSNDEDLSNDRVTLTCRF